MQLPLVATRAALLSGAAAAVVVIVARALRRDETGRRKRVAVILGTGAAFAGHHTTEAVIAAFLRQGNGVCNCIAQHNSSEGDTFEGLACTTFGSPNTKNGTESNGEQRSQLADTDFAKRVFEACGFDGHSVALPDKDLFRTMSRAEYLEHRRTCLLRLAELAAERALVSWGGDRAAVTHLYWGTMTGGMDSPTLDIRLARRLGLSPDVERTSMEGMGCLTGFRLLNIARQIALADPSARILVVTADLRSALGNSMPWDRALTREEMVSVALFRDSGSACVVGGSTTGAEEARYEVLAGLSRILSKTEHVADYQEASDTSITLRLGRELPQVISSTEKAFCRDMMSLVGLHLAECVPNADILCHTGGPRVLKGVAETLGVSSAHLAASWTVMRAHGNLSGASNLCVLDEHNHTRTTREWALGVSCGPGVCLESVLLRRLVHAPAPRHFQLHERPPWWDEEKVQTLRMGLVGNQRLRLSSHDVVVVSYPKSGARWLMQMASLLTNQPHADDLGLSVPCIEKTVSLGLPLDLPEDPAAPGHPVRPRCYSTHAHPEDWPFVDPPSATKSIFVVRNPKDVVSSHYAHLSQMPGNKGRWADLTAFTADYLKGRTMAGSWLEHTTKWRALSKRANMHGHILWLRYEDLQSDPEAALRQLAAFLEVPIVPEMLQRMQDLSSFKSIKDRVKEPQTGCEKANRSIGDGKLGSLARAPECERLIEDAWQPALAAVGLEGLLGYS